MTVLIDRAEELGLELIPSPPNIRWRYAGQELPTAARAVLEEVKADKERILGELLEHARKTWDDDLERARLDATYDWCDANWWAGAWDWCKDNRPDLYAEMDAALLAIDQAWKRMSVTDHAAACDALLAVVRSIRRTVTDRTEAKVTK